MALLNRFRQQGGFFQLLQLIETCEPVRQKKLFEMIAKEDPGWAYLVRLKTLTLDRVLSWPPSVLTRIWSGIPLPVLIGVWQKSSLDLRQKIEETLPRNYQASFKKGCEETPPLSDAEFVIAQQRLVAIVREMQLHGRIRFREFDPGLEFDGALAEQQDLFKKVA
jgi:flagellar motor switch protein FliG